MTVRIYQMPLSKKYGSKSVMQSLQALGMGVMSASSKVSVPGPVFLDSLEFMLRNRSQSAEALVALKARLEGTDAVLNKPPHPAREWANQQELTDAAIANGTWFPGAFGPFESANSNNQKEV